jgi:hypothetical protein
VACLCECARWRVAGGGGGGCAHGHAGERVVGCAGAFRTVLRQIKRNPACGWFNVFKYKGKWVGQVIARGVTLRTSGRADAWRAAVELEWLLDRWCREHGEGV